MESTVKTVDRVDFYGLKQHLTPR